MSKVIVVGSGAAGLTAALDAARLHEVTLLTKGALGESNSLYAQGGIASAYFDDDSAELHLRDTLAAGVGVGDVAAARILCEEGPERIRELIALGVDFDRDGEELARGREAAHSVARVLHAGGDATGREIVAALTAAVMASGVSVVEQAFVTRLVIADGAISGVECRIDGEARRLSADIVVLATGGAGHLFEHTTNPEGATGDGVALALAAGAAVSDLEFYQFHPTAMAVPGTPLISEAVRGDGAVLLDAAGRRFMLDVHPDAELVARDVVARAIAAVMERQAGAPVLLDARGLGGSIAARFPGFAALCARNGFDPTLEPVPVTPAAHYWMGGVTTDESGRSSIPGLFVVGEAACTGVHGANRLASNSLLEALVFGHRCVDAFELPWPGAATAAADPVPAAAAAVAPAAAITSPTRAELQHLMWSNVGLSRDETGLRDAAARLDSWRVDGEAVHELETANLLVIARAVTAAALRRTESIGAHHRADSSASEHAAPETAESSQQRVAIPC